MPWTDCRERIAVAFSRPAGKNDVIDTIRFQTTVGDDHLIRVPQEVPIGPVEVTIAPCAVDNIEPNHGTNLRDKLLAWAAHMEELNSELPPDLAANHDFYAHGKPRE